MYRVPSILAMFIPGSFILGEYTKKFARPFEDAACIVHTNYMKITHIAENVVR